MDGSAFAMAQSMINSAESDRDQLFKISHISITPSIKVALLSALKHSSTQDNLLLDSGLDQIYTQEEDHGITLLKLN